MHPTLRQLAKERAANRCEYCGLAQDTSITSFHVEHIVPRQHGGATDENNLALACSHCNFHKGPNLTGLDPDTGDIHRLYNPRREKWNVHFQFEGGRVLGLTPVGRTTAWLLKMNVDEQVALRSPP
jgi:hypothetical protein